MVLMILLISTTASANQPPTTPHIWGPTSGKAGVEHDFGLCSEDPNEDDITYIVDWGDGTGEEHIGPTPHGLCIIEEHAWFKPGEYTIRAKASDGQAESDWGELTVTMPRNRAIYNIFLYRFLQHFPLLERLLSLIF